MRVRRQFCISTGISIAMLALIAARVSPALCDAIHNAALAGDLAKVKALVKVNSSLVISQGTRNGTPLHFAVQHNHLDSAQFLLAHHADVNPNDNNGWSPLRFAEHQVTQSFAPHVCTAGQTNDNCAEHMKPVSPDGRYVAVLDYIADTWALSICSRKIVFEARRDKQKKSQRRIVLRRYTAELTDDISGIRWAPRHPHTLVFATSGIYSKARMAVWQGGKRAVTLVHSRLKKGSEEGFQLDGISKDGNMVYYGYFGDSHDQRDAHWKSYRVGVMPGSKPVRDHRNHGDMPPEVFDKNVMAYGI